jgi:hypothetical protein
MALFLIRLFPVGTPYHEMSYLFVLFVGDTAITNSRFFLLLVSHKATSLHVPVCVFVSLLMKLLITSCGYVGAVVRYTRLLIVLIVTLIRCKNKLIAKEWCI